MTISEFSQLIFCILAFVGFLRVVRIVRLFLAGVAEGYRAYRFQQQIAQIALAESNVSQQERRHLAKYENKVVPMTSPDKPKVLYVPPLEKHLTTVH